MDLPWGSDESLKFITNVGLITSDGPHGPNIMAAEWTHHVSYKPGLIAVCIGYGKATLENIQKTKKFGVSIATVDQSIVASISGNNSGREINKIEALKELGFRFYKGENGLPMVQDTAINLECKLFKEINLGDHAMMIGEVAEVLTSNKEPLAYHKGKYWILEKKIEKPSEKELERMERTVKRHKKK